MGRYVERIGSGSYSGDERWHPSEMLETADRRAIEEAYGQGPFTDEVWGEVLNHLDFFSAFAVVERNSITVPEMLELLDGLNKAATDLALSLASSNNPEAGFAVSQVVGDQMERLFRHSGRNNDAWDMIEAELAQELAGLDHNAPEDRAEEIVLGWRARRLLPEPLSADAMLDHSYELAAAAAFAAKSYKEGQEATTSEGEAWRAWVRGMARWADANRYPKKVSKGSDKSKDPDAASPFVRFIYAIQERMPPAFRKHHQSKGALATGITRALSDGSNGGAK